MKDNKNQYIIPRIHNLRNVWLVQWLGREYYIDKNIVAKKSATYFLFDFVLMMLIWFIAGLLPIKTPDDVIKMFLLAVINVTPLVTNDSQCKDDIYDGYDIHVCEDCGYYFCNDCINSIDLLDEYSYLCDSCFLESDDRTEEEKLIDEQKFIMMYSSLEFDDCEGGCQVCNHYDECLYDANENRDGELTFEDMVLSGGYDSIDDFWECNGI